VLFQGAVFSAHAALNCVPNGAYLDMFTGQYGGFFGYGDDFANVVIGSRVGPLREVNLRFTCNITPGTAQWGAGMKAANGVFPVTINGQTYYTTSQLAALGLGYQLWWHGASGLVHSSADPTQNSTPNSWTNVPLQNGVFDLVLPTRFLFFKINNNFQNTNGNYNQLNPALSANILTLYITGTPSSPASVAGSTYPYTLQLNTFSSVKCVCTPHVNQTIQFDYTTVANMQPLPAGPVNASTKEFSLTFNCPYMAWYTQGFQMQPVYGIVDATNGVIGIKTGAGFAQGVGIQVLVKDVATGWIGASQPDEVDNYTSPWQVVMPNQTYTIPALQYLNSQIHLNPAAEMKSKQVNFRARYYRLPGALTAGKVESAVIFHFIYQ